MQNKKLGVQSWSNAEVMIPAATIDHDACMVALPTPQLLRVPLETAAAEVVSLPVRPEPPQVCSYAFRMPVPVEPLPDRQRPAARQPARVGESRTRISPPADVVKLSERFFYLLQPDLETTLATSRLAFPHRPYPFQLEGIAFLVPRHAAVLADEMGLGKSMQAITAIRLLVHAGEARRVLVVCPKGLVSNWQRELAEWAPELPVAVIEGDPARRRWQWSLEGMPVVLANYEVLVRDEVLLAETGQSFDLVVCDEAQRIKNRGSRTSGAVRSLSRGRAWALTGTPIENAAADLVSIFEFVSPDRKSVV